MLTPRTRQKTRYPLPEPEIPVPEPVIPGTRNSQRLLAAHCSRESQFTTAGHEPTTTQTHLGKCKVQTQSPETLAASAQAHTAHPRPQPHSAQAQYHCTRLLVPHVAAQSPAPGFTAVRPPPAGSRSTAVRSTAGTPHTAHPTGHSAQAQYRRLTQLHSRSISASPGFTAVRRRRHV